MPEAQKIKSRFINLIVKLHIQKTADLFNRLLASSLGIRITSVYTPELHKSYFDRLLYFARLLNLLENVEGDIVECGVAEGRTLSMFMNLLRSNNIDRHIWGFDSWGGLPEPTKEDLTSTESEAKRGKYKANIKMLLNTLEGYGFDNSEIENRVTLIKGLFSSTLPEYRGRIALLHIDVDLYNSYKECLYYLWDKVSIGGIVAFDEYHAPERWPGAKQAVDEFLGQLAHGSMRLHKDVLSGRYYAIKLR